MTLRNQLKNVKIRNSETILSHFTRVAQIKEHLEAVEENVEEGEIVMATLNGLPRSWDSFIQGIHVRRKCWWNCHWCQHGLAVAPRYVIDATKSHLQYLDPSQSGFVSWKHFVPGWPGPCTHKLGSWSHRPADSVEDPGGGLKALWMMEKPLIGWRNINDPFCGHLWFDGVMKPTQRIGAT